MYIGTVRCGGAGHPVRIYTGNQKEEKFRQKMQESER
jgi:hypothetical protein